MDFLIFKIAASENKACIYITTSCGATYLCGHPQLRSIPSAYLEETFRKGKIISVIYSSDVIYKISYAILRLVTHIACMKVEILFTHKK